MRVEARQAESGCPSPRPHDGRAALPRQQTVVGRLEASQTMRLFLLDALARELADRAASVGEGHTPQNVVGGHACIRRHEITRSGCPSCARVIRVPRLEGHPQKMASA